MNPSDVGMETISFLYRLCGCGRLCALARNRLALHKP